MQRKKPINSRPLMMKQPRRNSPRRPKLTLRKVPPRCRSNKNWMPKVSSVNSLDTSSPGGTEYLSLYIFDRHPKSFSLKRITPQPSTFGQWVASSPSCSTWWKRMHQPFWIVRHCSPVRVVSPSVLNEALLPRRVDSPTATPINWASSSPFSAIPTRSKYIFICQGYWFRHW